MRLRLIAAGWILALSGIASADRVKVAVVPGIAVNLDAARVDALSQDLAEALRTELDVDAIGGLEVRRQLPAAGLPPDCVATQSCIVDVARRLDAQQLLFVVMIDTGTGGAIQVDSTWVEPAAGKTASRPAIDIAAIADAKSRFAAAAQQLLPDAPLRPKPGTGLGRMSPAVPRHFTRPAYITTGATIAGLGVGVTLGLMARSRYRECSDLAENEGLNCSPERKDSIRTVALIADAGWLVAIGGAVATAVLYATSSETPRVIVEPMPGGAAVTAVGRFW
jgi:hypothetical protein